MNAISSSDILNCCVLYAIVMQKMAWKGNHHRPPNALHGYPFSPPASLTKSLAGPVRPNIRRLCHQ